MIPLLRISNPVLQVSLPALSQLVEWPERFSRYYLKLLGIVALHTVPIAALCITEGRFLIMVLFGPKRTGAVAVLRLLTAACLIQRAGATTGLVQVSLGKSRRYLVWGVVTAVCFVCSFVIGLPFGIVGVAGVYAIANYLLLVPTVRFCLRDTPIRDRTVCWEIGVPIFICALVSAAALLTEAAAPSGSALGHILAICVFVLICVLASLSRGSVRETVFVVNRGVFAGLRK